MFEPVLPFSTRNDLAPMVTERLRKDLHFGVFYLAPAMVDFKDDLQWLATTYNLRTEEAAQYRRDLMNAGYWIRSESGTIQLNRAKLGAGAANSEQMSPAEFMSMATQLLTRISPDGPCWYAAHNIATTRELKLEFLSEVNRALNSLIEKSKSKPSETIVSWAHISLDTLKSLHLEEEP